MTSEEREMLRAIAVTLETGVFHPEELRVIAAKLREMADTGRHGSEE